MQSVDIVIAAKNEQRYLGQCLDSLAAQDYPQELIRVIVVDNASTDNTAKIAGSKGALVVHKHGGTLGAVRNFGYRTGTGDLIGFMDAHCIADPGWVTAMVARFESPLVGGCQGVLTNICPHPLTQELSRGFVLFDDQTLWEYGVSGLRTPYPWATGGNSMYRRAVLEQLDGFDQSLFAAEDSDISWRTVLAGYLIEYAPSARLTHYDLNTARTYLRKMFVYGRADALVAHKFGWFGKREPPPIGSKSKRPWLHFHVLNLFSRLGYEYEHWRVKLKLIQPPEAYRYPAIPPERRACLRIDGQQSLTIGPHVVHWFPTEELAIVVETHLKHRLVLEDTAAHIFRNFVRLGSVSSTIDAVTAQYEIDKEGATAHVNALLDSLVREGIFVGKETADADPRVMTARCRH